jgi:galactose mutarotase-like enzyme
MVLPFSIGGHPGFYIPLEDGIDDEDHYLEFSEICSPIEFGFSKDNFLNGNDTPYPLKDGKRIDFSHKLFYKKGIFLSGMPNEISLRAKNSKRYLKMSYKNASVLGLWHAPDVDAPYICIEPWKGIPSTQGIVDDFSSKREFVFLNKNQSFTLEYTIEVNE